MKRLQLQPVEHTIKVGHKCAALEPTVTEDCILVSEDGTDIGFYMRKVPERLGQLLDVANAEFRSDRVPKSIMRRSSAITTAYATNGNWRSEDEIQQFSTILGGVAPRPHMRRPDPRISSVHQSKEAETFVKAMLLAAKEAEKLIEHHLPTLATAQREIVSRTAKKWRFGSMFTSSISNFNIAASYHRDTGNLKGCANVILTKRNNSKGGNLHVPDYDATFEQCDGSILVYPAWRNVHGVTPIEPTHEGGYRNSLIFYALKCFEGHK